MIKLQVFNYQIYCHCFLIKVEKVGSYFVMISFYFQDEIVRIGIFYLVLVIFLGMIIIIFSFMLIIYQVYRSICIDFNVLNNLF